MLSSTATKNAIVKQKHATMMQLKGGDVIILVGKLPTGEIFSGVVIQSSSSSYELGHTITNMRTCNFKEYIGQVTILNE